MAAIAKTKLNVGLLGFGVELHKATQDEGGVAMDSLCECEKRPKMSVNCGCGATYTSFQALPKKGYPKDAKKYSVILSKQEIEAARAGAAQHESLVVEKVADLVSLAMVCGFGDSYYCVPDREAKDFELKLYALCIKALAATNRAMLARLTSRGVTTRYAIISDPNKGVLVALKVLDLREVPFEIAPIKVRDGEEAQARMFLDAQYAEDASFPAEEDGLVAEIERRLTAAPAPAAEAPAVEAKVKS